MGGVDRFDQYTFYYKNDTKGYKKYDRLTYHILDMMMNNSFLLYKESSVIDNKSHIAHCEFIRHVIKILLKDEKENRNIMETKREL